MRAIAGRLVSYGPLGTFGIACLLVGTPVGMAHMGFVLGEWPVAISYGAACVALLAALAADVKSQLGPYLS